MNLIEAMKQNNLVINTKGGKYYKETYNSSLDELKYEIADVMNYCILLCHQIGVDPKEIILEKMKISEKKYPIEKAKGKCTKYNKL